MCGFVGYAFEGNPPGGLLERMNATIRHRGPDGEGFFREGGIGLGHRRLAVIDVEGGRQPLYNEDESVVVVYNGEIYNFQELRGRLEDRGHRFATNTDTEVLVHLYEEEGESFLPRLNGIFAFALYDRKRRLLMLARDPVGVKPLYYGIVDGGVLFGSELKALAACERFSRKIDPEALSAYLTLEYVPNPMSLYRDARKLLPGHALILEGLRERVFRYWDWPPIEPFAGDYDSAQEALRDAVRTSVREQMISDVPLGVFLSGGVDSSVVADSAVAAGGDVQTYSIGFEEPSFDESGFARRTAEHLETVHGDRLFSERELLEGLPGILASMDEPLADPSLLPSALLSAFARESITVALGGDGGDELFAGYPTYWVHRLHPLYQKTPGFLRRGLLSAADALLPVRFENLTFSYKLRKFREGAEEPFPERHFYWMGAMGPVLRSEVLREPMQDDPGWWRPVTEWMAPPSRGGPVTRAQWLDFHTYLVEDILAKVDRASMMSSLEVRVPLLDPRVVRLAYSLPEAYLLKGFQGKRVLKDAFKDAFPKEQFRRPKKGFGIPLSKWLSGPLRAYGEDRLRPDSLEVAPFLDAERVKTLWEEHLEGAADHRKPLWTILTLLDWVRRTGATL